MKPKTMKLMGLMLINPCALLALTASSATDLRETKSEQTEWCIEPTKSNDSFWRCSQDTPYNEVFFETKCYAVYDRRDEFLFRTRSFKGPPISRFGRAPKVLGKKPKKHMSHRQTNRH
jgi:hypothetical protein